MAKKCMFAVMGMFAVVWMSGPVNAGLISHYSFDIENSGTTPDSVGSAYAALGNRVTINTSTGESKVGSGALEMMGGGSDVGPGDGAITSNSFSWTNDARTVTFWWRARSPNTDTKDGAFVSFGDNADNGTRFEIKEQTSTKHLRVEVQGTGSNSTPAIDDGQWHFIAVVVPDNAVFSDIAWYVDGDTTSLNTSTNTLDIATGIGPLAFGDSVIVKEDTHQDRVPNGFLDDFQLYDKVLTQGQLTYLYNNPGFVIGRSAIPDPANGDVNVDSALLTELSWQGPLTKDDPDGDPNLVSVDRFDLTVYSKLTADVTADDPNFITNGVTYTDVTSPFALTLDYDTTYFWRVDTHGTWDSNSTSEAVEGADWRFSTLPSYIQPVIENFKNVLTAVDLSALLSATISGNSKPITNVTFTLLDTDFEYPAGANALLTDTTVDNQNPTVILDTDTAGLYKVKLEVSDGVTVVEKTVAVNVYSDACQARKDSPSEWIANYYDIDGNCLVDLTDFAALAKEWLDDTRLDVQENYTGDALFLEADIVVQAEDAYAPNDPNYVTAAPLTAYTDTGGGGPHIGSNIAYSNGKFIGWSGSDKFVTYSVPVPQAGAYTVYVGNAFESGGSARSIAFGTVSPDGDPSNDDIYAYGQIALSDGTGWDNVKIDTASLTFADAGTYLIRVTWIGGGVNLDFIALKKE